jgi:hypothetical protein
MFGHGSGSDVGGDRPSDKTCDHPVQQKENRVIALLVLRNFELQDFFY